MINAMARWRAVPDPRRKPVEPEPGLSCGSPAHVDLLRVVVAGLAELPNHVVALTAVPGLGARLLGTSPSLSGAARLAVVPFRLCYQ
jgi:hypothetical protein